MRATAANPGTRICSVIARAWLPREAGPSSALIRSHFRYHTDRCSTTNSFVIIASENFLNSYSCSKNLYMAQNAVQLKYAAYMPRIESQTPSVDF
jgi:hypothetical protein